MKLQRSGGPKECHAILPIRGGRIQACRRSERWRVFGRGCTEEVRRCAGRFERAVTMVLLLRDDRDGRGWIGVVARSLSARQPPRLCRSRRVLPQCSNSVARGAIADTADVHSKRSLCENAKIWKVERMIFLKSTKTGQACDLCVLNCDLTERLFYCAWGAATFLHS